MTTEGKGRDRELPVTRNWHRWVMEVPTEPKSAPMVKHPPPTLREYLISQCKEELYDQSETWSIAPGRGKQPLDPKPYLGKGKMPTEKRQDPVPTAPKWPEYYVNNQANQGGQKVGPPQKEAQKNWIPPEPPIRPIVAPRKMAEAMQAYPIYPQVFGLTPIPATNQLQQKPQPNPEKGEKRHRGEGQSKNKTPVDNDESDTSSATTEKPHRKKQKREVWLNVGGGKKSEQHTVPENRQNRVWENRGKGPKSSR